VPRANRLTLESEPYAKLCLERYSEGFRETRRAKEVYRLAKVRRAGNVLELSTEVCGVENIESFEEESKFAFFAEVEELRDANVQLRESIAANVI